MSDCIDTSIAAIVERAADVIRNWPKEMRNWPKEMQLEKNRYPKSRHSIRHGRQPVDPGKGVSR
jgi:hypothetical protein